MTRALIVVVMLTGATLVRSQSVDPQLQTLTQAGDRVGGRMDDPRWRELPKALDAYAKGQFDAVTARFGGAWPLVGGDARFESDAQELERVGPQWIAGQGASAAPARRLVAATFALDIARTVWLRSDTLFAANRRQLALRFVAWGCARMREMAQPDDRERLWYFASLSMNEVSAWLSADPSWDAFLLGQDWPRPSRAASASREAPKGQPSTDPLPRELAEGHLAHILVRFPDVPEFEFARARAIVAATRDIGRVGVPAERQTTDPLGQEITEGYLSRLSPMTGTPASHPVISVTGSALHVEDAVGVVSPADESLRIEELRRARAIFERLAQSGPLQAAAHLWAGVIALRFADRAAAIHHFEAVPTLSTDAALRYDAHLLLGVAHERLEEWDAAIESYRAALVAVPARGAAARLTALLLRRGRAAEAESFGRVFLTAEGTPSPDRFSTPDPWLDGGELIDSPFAGAFDRLRKLMR